MHRRHAVAALALLVLAACQDRQQPAAPVGDEPAFQISDGFSTTPSNPEFFFLPPIRPLGSRPPATGFNANLAPVARICKWNQMAGACAGPTQDLTLTSGTPFPWQGARARLDGVAVYPRLRIYLALWNTAGLGLKANDVYRARILAGGKELGFVDAKVVQTFLQLLAVNTSEYVPLLKNSILPIPFWIGDKALCDPPGSDCTSQTVDLGVGGTVATPNGDGLVVPAQPADDMVTITVQSCEDIDVDLPKFGTCQRITVDPPLAEGGLVNPAIVFQCSLPAALPAGLSEEQEDLITLYRQDGDQVTALPHATFQCPTLGWGGAPPRNLVEAGWRWLGAAAGALLGARPLYALHLGPAGETFGFSDFQFVLPAKMTPLEGTGAHHAASVPGPSTIEGRPAPVPPGVLVSDTAGHPVAGATVHFEVTLGGGTVTPLAVTTGADGIAQVSAWVLGHGGENGVDASGRGIAGPGDYPFMPHITPTGGGTAVEVGTGHVLFRANAVLVSGVSEVGTRDAFTQFQAGDAWEDAFVVAPHEFYSVIPQTHYLNYHPTQEGEANTSRTYRTTFTLPAGYSDPGFDISIHADNVATIFLNGTQIGTQADAEIFENFQDPPEHFSTTSAGLFHAGANVVEFVIKNYGDGTGFDYMAFVTYTRP